MDRRDAHASASANVRGGGTAREADVDRIAERLGRLAAQRAALRKAMSEFGEDFDYEPWAQAFVSSEPDDINSVLAVTGGYQALVNNVMEAVKVGARLAGVSPTAGARGAAGLIEAIRVEGGISDAQASIFSSLYRTRNSIQHASPDIEADEAHSQVRALLAHLPGFVKSCVAWLGGRGITLS